MNSADLVLILPNPVRDLSSRRSVWTRCYMQFDDYCTEGTSGRHIVETKSGKRCITYDTVIPQRLL